MAQHGQNTKVLRYLLDLITIIWQKVNHKVAVGFILIKFIQNSDVHTWPKVTFHSVFSYNIFFITVYVNINVYEYFINCNKLH